MLGQALDGQGSGKAHPAPEARSPRSPSGADPGGRREGPSRPTGGAVGRWLKEA